MKRQTATKTTKYEGALYYLMTETIAYNNNVLIPIAEQAHNDLLELINRDKPMLVDEKTFSTFDNWWDCPKCKEGIIKQGDNYCSRCGQKVDRKQIKLTSKNKNILRMPIPNTNSFGTNFTTNSFGTNFTPNHLTEEEATEALYQAMQTIAKKK